MQVWRGLEGVPVDRAASAMTFGVFDGLHRGHRSVVAALTDAARERGLASVAVTFDRHPLRVLRPEGAPALLTTPEHQLELLEGAGVDAVLVLPFTEELASWDPRRFVEEVVVAALGASLVVVGDDARFGRAHAGDAALLRELGDELGFEVVALETVQDGTAGRRWSSTWVREAIAAGDVATAAEVLGRPHRVEGVVVHGDHRGRELGYPTANLGEIAVAVPADGVYAAWLVLLDDGPPAAGAGRAADAVPALPRRLPAAVSIGTNPTFDGLVRQVEAHVIGLTGIDLYGRRAGLDLVERLRPTLRFDSAEALVVQMDLDTARCADLLGVPRP